MSDPIYGLWEACPNESTLALGFEGALEGGVFTPTAGHETWRGNPDPIRAFLVEWDGWVSGAVAARIAEIADVLDGGREEVVLYEDLSNATKVVAGQRGEPGVLYVIAYKM